MQRTTIMLPNDLKARALRRAKELGVSFGEFVRESLSAQLSRADQNADDPLFADQAVFEEEAATDVATDHDRYLYGDSP
jgi:hypothetical protein